jgi:5-methylcytosine-specific restriction endonuclease McrA|tara:strand:+ start:291 stop:1223 length:933 start_codon:yes stop_codon:yes gene_type:complete
MSKTCIGKNRDGTDCDKDVRYNNMCANHCQMFERYGRVEYLKPVDKTTLVCKVKNDPKPCSDYYAMSPLSGYCDRHYRAFKKYGDPLFTMIKKPSNEKACTQCGNVKPLSEYGNKFGSYDGATSKCKVCISENFKAYRNKPENREKIRAGRRRWYEENKESEIQKSLDWLNANPDKVLESAIKYRENHREELNAKSKAYRLDNHEKCLAKEQARTRIYRANKAKAKSDGHTLSDLHKYFHEQGIDPTVCTYCEKFNEKWKTSQGDHVIPLNKGGSDTMDNIMPCCVSCNASKSDRILYEEWIPLKERLAA